MKTYTIRDAQGQLMAFEVDSILFPTSRTLRGLLSRHHGVSSISRKTSAFKGKECLLSFTFREVSLVVWEPFGDSSRYWVGPEVPEDARADLLEEVERLFRDYRPPLLLRALAAIVSLDLDHLRV